MTIRKTIEDGTIFFTMKGDDAPLFAADLDDLDEAARQICVEKGVWHMLGDKYAGYQEKAADAGMSPRAWVVGELAKKWESIKAGERVLAGGSGQMPIIGLAIMRASPGTTAEEVQDILDGLPEISGTDDEKKEARKARAKIIKSWLDENPILKAAHDAIKAERALAKAKASQDAATADESAEDIDLTALRTHTS